MALSSTIRTLRSRDISDSIPFNVGQPGYVSDVWTNTTVAYDVAIGGLPFFYGINNDRPYERQTAPYKKQQFDNSKEPGEQTLEGWWIRSQSSFHRGAGITFFDPSAGEEVDYRFKTSQGVDVWTKGQVTLLKKVTAGHETTTSSQKLRSIRYSSTDAVLSLDGHDVDKILGDGTAVHFIDYNSGTDDPVYAICDDGTTAYWATNDIDASVNKAHLYKKALTLTSSDADTLMFNVISYTCTAGKVVMEWVKGRIILCADNKVYELTPSSSTLGSAIFTHPNTSYTFTSVAESGAAIYVAGYAGTQSAIYKFTLSSAGAITSLTSAVVTAEMPIGEIIHSIKYYLGYMVIGTNKGIRVATVPVDDGSIAYGPLIVETSQPVYDFCFRDRFVWATTKVEGNAGLTRIDLSEQISPLRFAYANDVYTESTSNTTTSCAFLGTSNRIVFTAATSYHYVESASEYVDSGYLQTGFIRYGTLEPKNFKRVRARRVNGSYAVHVLEGSHDIEFSSSRFVGHVYALSSAVDTMLILRSNTMEGYNVEVNRFGTNALSGVYIENNFFNTLSINSANNVVVRSNRGSADINSYANNISLNGVSNALLDKNRSNIIRISSSSGVIVAGNRTPDNGDWGIISGSSVNVNIRGNEIASFHGVLVEAGDSIRVVSNRIVRGAPSSGYGI